LLVAEARRPCLVESPNCVPEQRCCILRLTMESDRMNTDSEKLAAMNSVLDDPLGQPLPSAPAAINQNAALSKRASITFSELPPNTSGEAPTSSSGAANLWQNLLSKGEDKGMWGSPTSRRRSLLAAVIPRTRSGTAPSETPSVEPIAEHAHSGAAGPASSKSAMLVGLLTGAFNSGRQRAANSGSSSDVHADGLDDFLSNHGMFSIYIAALQKVLLVQSNQ
jgi:hypothetical protein